MQAKAGHDQLLKVIRSVRRRWRLRVALRGIAIVLGAGVLVFLVSTFGMDRFRFSPGAVIAFRIFAYLALVGLAVRFLVLPLLRRVSDQRVALYLEEHEPSLGARLLSAIEFGRADSDSTQVYSAALVGRLVENALEQCAAVDYGRRVEARPLTRSTGLLAGTSLAALTLLLLAPPFVRHSTPYLLPWGGVSPENPYSILVTPGNAKVARGAELKIVAQLQNFSSDKIEIAVQSGTASDWERFPMTLDEETGTYWFFLFDLQAQAEYLVESSGVRSPLFRVDVVELPYVEQLTLEYHFPAYTGLQPQKQEDGGDIAALKGTEVHLFVTPTVPVVGGAIVFEDTDTIPLTAGAEGTLTGQLTVQTDGLYRIVFETADGDQVVGSPEYLVDVLTDQPPYVSFGKPGRDIKVTNIEEVFIEVEAEDDYGVRSVELVYSINGGTEEKVWLYQGRGTRKEISAGHTFYLEEIELEPGDFVSYYARASDDNGVTGRQLSTTDIYFMEIRPFDRKFRQADQSGGGGGAGGFDSSLSRRQRDVIAATFKMVRDRDKYVDKEYNENLATLTLVQGRLREQVEALVARIEARGIVDLDPSFKTISEALPAAAEAMREAEGLLGERQPQPALAPEQRALQQLQRAEAAFREVQVAQGEPSGGGGGGPMAEELAELFELELDKQRNQYESVQRDRQQQANEQIDETLQKLQELARRQQQENERLRARASDARSQAGGGGGSQRQLAEEAEELARKLERLAREESRPELNRSARQLREAAEDMRRASASKGNAGVAEGNAALDRLKEARRQLDSNRSAGLQREVEEALRRANRLAQEQREVLDEVERLSEAAAGRGERLRRLIERKEEMAREVAELEGEIEKLARESRREQRDASRKLQEAARSIRDSKLTEKIRYSRGVVQQRSDDYVRNFEEQIAQDIDTLREKLGSARAAIGETKEQRLARTLDETRDLARSLESLEERTGEQAQAAQPGESGGAEGSEAAEGAPRNGGGRVSEDTSDGFPGFSPEETRQFQREFGERRSTAERLRESLRGEGVAAEELEGIIQGLRRLENRQAYGDPRGLAELQAAIIRELKDFEYRLSRRLGEQGERELLLTGSDEVPPGYRELVEEYYRALAGQGRR